MSDETVNWGGDNSEISEEETKKHAASLGNIAHRYPINKNLWNKMEDLSIQGAALYSFGIDPDTIDGEIEHCGREDNSLDELPEDFWVRVRIIKSAVRSGSIKRVPVSSDTDGVDNHTLILKDSFLGWSKKHKKMWKPVEAKAAFPQYQPAIKPDSADIKEPEDLSPRDREKLLKMIIGMAIGAYKYNSDDKRNAATGEKSGSIFAHLELAGVPIDVDDIREYVKEANEILRHLKNT